MSKKHLSETHPKICEDWDFKRNEFSPNHYTKGSHKKVWWKCKKGHEWLAIISDRVRGNGCPYCSNKRVCKDNSLIKTHPEIAKEWNYDKNELGPENYTYGSGKKVWWKCKMGHEWFVSINKKTNGRSCPYCSNRIACNDNNLLKTYPEIAKEWNYDKNEFDPENYTHCSGKKVWWKCKKGHEWLAIITDRAKKVSGCPYCSGRMPTKDKNLLKTHPEVAKEWNYEKNEFGPENYTNGSNKKVWWKCKKGHSWLAIIQSRVRGNGCPYCSNQKVCKDNNLTKTHSKLCKEWDYKKNAKNPENYTYGSGKKVWWKCKKGHSWKTQIKDRVTKKSGCLYCSNRKVCKDNNLLKTHPEVAKEWNYEKNEFGPECVVYGSTKKVWWKCKKGHEWRAIIHSRANGINCPYCSNQKVCKDNSVSTTNPDLCKEWHPTKNECGPENYTYGSGKIVWWRCKNGHEWAASINKRTALSRGCPYCSNSISKVSSSWLDELKIDKREIKVGRFRVDGLNGNTVYEYLGAYWHGDPRKFHPNEINERAGRKYGTLLFDTIKRFNEICNLGYKIIYCWEYEEIEKEYILIKLSKKQIIKKAIEIYVSELNIDILENLL